MNNYIVEAYGIDSLLTTIADKTSETLTKSIAYAQKPKYGKLRLVANRIRNIYDRYFTKNTIIIVGIFLIWYKWPYIYPGFIDFYDKITDIQGHKKRIKK
jgi:hypothetical protein